ncbi:hypothetical protein PybrP1_007077 [[Pythium] brassicae (nom. inval.)]|nr:hypothetical protein PybrP1_007077 [[Pythium] brassicae (nom. inval.)]
MKVAHPALWVLCGTPSITGCLYASLDRHLLSRSAIPHRQAAFSLSPVQVHTPARTMTTEPKAQQPAATRRMPPLVGVVMVLAGCVVASLLLDVSLLDLQRLAKFPAPVHHSLKQFVAEYELADAPAWLSATPPEVPAADLLHFSLLQAACLEHTESVLPWTYARPGPDQEDAAKNLAEHIIYRDNPRLLDVLRQCPEVDVYLPASIRGHGYCEDAVAYAKCALSQRTIHRVRGVVYE